MENNNIILFILILLVLYLLFCDNRKNRKIQKLEENFAATTSTKINQQDKTDDNVSDDNVSDDNVSDETKDSTIITESIKNLGILAKRIHNEKGDFTFPANLNVTGKFNLLPAGTIVIWIYEEIPVGWRQCDGTYGTPDLRGRFVIGKGQARYSNGDITLEYNGAEESVKSKIYQIDERGGWEKHKLIKDEIPSHTHRQYYVGGNNPINSLGNYGLHAKYPKVRGGETTATGGDEPHNNMPPYYVLIYIMKVY